MNFNLFIKKKINILVNTSLGPTTTSHKSKKKHRSYSSGKKKILVFKLKTILFIIFYITYIMIIIIDPEKSTEVATASTLPSCRTPLP